MDVKVVSLCGDHVGDFNLNPTASVLELKQRIASSGGPPSPFQKLVVETTLLQDEQTLQAIASTDTLIICLSVQCPDVEKKYEITASWKSCDGSGGLLDKLAVSQTRKNGEGAEELADRIPAYHYSAEGGRVGMDPDSGLLLVVEECLANSQDPIPTLLIIPSVESPYDIPLEDEFPLMNAIEMHVMQLKDTPVYPLPPISFGIAILKEETVSTAGGKGKESGTCGKKGKGKETGKASKGANQDSRGPSLVEFEFCPGYLSTTSLCADPVVDSACLDRSIFPPRAFFVSNNAGKRSVQVKPLHEPSKASQQLCCLSDSTNDAVRKGRVTSMAWACEENSLLFTVAGSHAVYVLSSASDKGEWHVSAVIGDEKSRGCQDGPRADLRFWFPCSKQREADDPIPLISGPGNTLLVYSGGVLMQLTSSLSSATKVASMRQELWMTDYDEGTPEFPTVGRVLGVHKNKVYRTIQATDYTEAMMIRRLEADVMLRQPRSEIRRSSPMLWPSINTDRRLHEEYPDPNFPAHYDETHRDTWDGNTNWIWDDWLWEGLQTTSSQDGSAGVGSTILGADGSVWGKVVADEGHAWKLESGRIAKKETEGVKWKWAPGASGVGSTILGADGSLWGKVVADQGNAWKLEGGRIAKKETEGIKWKWADGASEARSLS